MANLRLAMDSSFWDLNISTTQTLDGIARLIPSDPIPLDGTPAARVLRPQQLSLLSRGFPLGIIPTFSPASSKDLGNFSFHSLLLKPATSNWWLGVIGQLRPKKLIEDITAEVIASCADEWELPAFSDGVKPFLNKSLYSLGLCTQLALSPVSSLLFSTEAQGERNELRSKAKYFHKLPEHDITFEAAWPELFIDRNGRYWNVPESISLNLSSLVSESGLRYRCGLHRNRGNPQAVNAIDDPPVALMPGLCAKASFSYEKNRDIWREKQTQETLLVKTENVELIWPSYDARLGEPHAAVSGIVGGNCTAWITGRGSSMAFSSGTESGDGKAISAIPMHRSLFSADFFGSVCCTLQKGKFRKAFGDLTRVDARFDICSASAFTRSAANVVSNIFRSPQAKREANPLASPRLNVIFQQQVIGPIIFRVDSKFSLGSTPERHGPHFEDLRYSLSYSLRLLQSGKVVAWYSPKRKEAMIELRLFEF